MTQLLCHLWGDYILQSDWMAQNKTKEWWPAAVHALLYSLTFLLLRPSATACLVIFGTHVVIDRFRLARYVVWAKNWLLSPRYLWNPDGSFYLGPGVDGITVGGAPPFNKCASTGYPPERPAWLAVWLLIIADNVLHLTINFFALRYL
jgi:hypothetical protein